MRYLTTLLVTTTILTTNYVHGADPEQSWEDAPTAPTSQENSVRSHTTLAFNPNADIKDRLESAQKLFSAPKNDIAIKVYKAIIDSINKSRMLSVADKFSYLIKAEIGLHKAGDSKTALPLLSEHIAWLKRCIKTQSSELSYVDTYVVVTATEILFNAEKVSEEDALLLFDWAVKNTTSASSATILHAAETTERLGFLNTCKKYLKYFLRFSTDKDLKDRADALHARAFAEEANFSKCLKEGIALCSNGNSKEGIEILITQFRWFCNCNPTKQDELYVDTHSIITAVEILFKNGNFDVSSAAAVIRWAVDHTYDSSIKEETILYAAKTTERLGDHKGGQDIIDCKYSPNYRNGSTKELKARLKALEAKLARFQAK
jgi:hypothetical protein